MLAAILFDLDGTIANTDPIHYRVWQEMLLNYSIEIDETFYKSRISGRLNPEIVKDILPQLSTAEGQKFADEKEALFRKLAPDLKPLSGFSELLKWTETHQLKRALVTNAPRLNAEFMLEVLGIKEAFHTVVLADDCVAGKPDPAPYQVALNKLGIRAEEAIALEDSPLVFGRRWVQISALLASPPPMIPKFYRKSAHLWQFQILLICSCGHCSTHSLNQI